MILNIISLLLTKLAAFALVTAIWTLVFFVYLSYSKRTDNTTDLLIAVFLTVIAIGLTWWVRRFYFSQPAQNIVHLVAIETLIITVSSCGILWIIPDVFALFKEFGADLPQITRLASTLYPYVILLPLLAVIILLLSLRASQAQVAYLWLSHGLFVLTSGTIILYIGAAYAPIMFMCCVI